MYSKQPEAFFPLRTDLAYLRIYLDDYCNMTTFVPSKVGEGEKSTQRSAIFEADENPAPPQA